MAIKKKPQKPVKAAPKAAAKASAKPAKAAASTKGKAVGTTAGAAANEAGAIEKRKLGLRGAAPWAARHAAKHAAEARARAAEPAPPGSARATIRVPTGADQIKAKIGDLHNQMQRIRALRKRLDKGFFEIGQVLNEIQLQELHVAKGFGTFEAFLDRELDLGKLTGLRLIKISQTFQKDAALDYGMDRLFAALAALEGDLAPKPAPSSPGSKPLSLPMKPPMRIVG